MSTALEKVDSFVSVVIDKDRRETLMASLPSHVKPERFERNLIIAVQNHPKLLECDPLGVFNEVAKAGALGLYLDPTLGEAYLITGWSSQAKALVPQLRLGYRGLIKLGRQSGEIASIYAHAVHENDAFEASMGTEQVLVHRPNFMKDRGPVVLYYAVVKYRDGTVDFEPMSIEDIHAIRDRSDGFKAWLDKKIRTTPWASDEGEMAKKTVVRRLMKRLPQSPEIGEALEIENEDFQEPRPIPPPSLAKRLTSGHTAPKLGFQGPAGVDRAVMDETLEGDDLPDLNVDEPSAEPVIVRDETPPQQEIPIDPLDIDLLEASPDQRVVWVEAFRAATMKVKSADGTIRMMAKYHPQFVALHTADEALYGRLETWAGERVKRYRQAEAKE